MPYGEIIQLTIKALALKKTDSDACLETSKHSDYLIV